MRAEYQAQLITYDVINVAVLGGEQHLKDHHFEFFFSSLLLKLTVFDVSVSQLKQFASYRM
jgi:hypothetical protein